MNNEKYEYLLENLISYNQVYNNLTRTNEKHLISEMNRSKLIELALKHFGVNEYGEYTPNKEDIVAYRCPYSGEIISEEEIGNKGIHLDHIIPVNSNGGTVIFNCIPVLASANLSKQDTPNLLVWWTDRYKEHFDYERLERLIKYILEAYEIKDQFEEISIDPNDLDNENTSINRNDTLNKNEDLSISRVDPKGTTDTPVSYYQLINSLIKKLKENRDVYKYSQKLEELKQNNVFGEIEEIEKIIDIVQEMLKNNTTDSKNNYLSYSLNIDMKRLFESLKTKNYKKEIEQRFENIKSILKENNISLTNYYKNLSDIENLNLLYMNEYTDKQVEKFINVVKIDMNTKMDIFIKMAANPKYTCYERDNLNRLQAANNDKNMNIFAKNNSVPYEGIPEEYKDDFKIGQFWNNHKTEINNRINERLIKLQENEKNGSLTTDEIEEKTMLEKAKAAADTYTLIVSYDITANMDIFIKMAANPKYTCYKRDNLNRLQAANNDKNMNIFASDNSVPYEGIPEEYKDDFKIGHFWSNHKTEINNRINERLIKLQENEKNGSLTTDEIEEKTMLEKAKAAADTYTLIASRDITTKVDKFINMLLNDDYTRYNNDKIDSERNLFSSKNSILYEGVPKEYNLTVGNFWTNQGIKEIIPRLFFSEDYKDPKFNKSRDKVMEYLNYNQRRKKQSEFQNIVEYISTLDQTKKEVKSLIELYNSEVQENEILTQTLDKVNEVIESNKVNEGSINIDNDSDIGN